MTRICYGEFDWPDGNSKQAYLRNLFIKTLSEHAPDLCEELYCQAFPIYNALVKRCGRQLITPTDSEDERESGSNRTLSAIDILFLRESVEDDDCANDPRPLMESVTSSLMKWNLNTSWMLEITLNTLQLWSHFSKKPERLPFCSTVWGGFKPRTPEPPNGYSPYDPLAMLRDWYLDTIQKQALAIITNDPLLGQGDRSHAVALVSTIAANAWKYCDEVEECHETAGFVRCHPNERRNLAQHLEWTVRYQVSRETLISIAQDAGVNNASSVSRAVSDILKLIGLRKRPDAKPGRTRGTKNKRTPMLRALGR